MEKRIRSFEEMMQAIGEEGFLPLHKNFLPGFSLEERADEMALRTEAFPLDWVRRAVLEREALLGRLPCGEVLVSKELLPWLVSYQRDHRIFCDAGLPKGSLEGRIMTLYTEKGVRPAYTAAELQELFGAEREETEKAIRFLVLKTYLCMGDYREEWVYMRPEHLWDPAFLFSEYEREDLFSELYGKLKENHPDLTGETACRLLGEGREDLPTRHSGMETTSRLKRGHTFPNNLIEDIFGTRQEMDASYPEAALLALSKAMGRLEPREEQILRIRYEENQVYEVIASCYGISKERIRQIIRNGLEHLRTTEVIRSFQSVIGNEVIKYWEEERIEKAARRRHKAAEIMARREQIPPVEQLEPQTLLQDVGLSSRVVKCLMRNGYRSVGQIVWEYQQDPSLSHLHNFGSKTREELLEKLEEMGLL